MRGFAWTYTLKLDLDNGEAVRLRLSASGEPVALAITESSYREHPPLVLYECMSVFCAGTRRATRVQPSCELCGTLMKVVE